MERYTFIDLFAGLGGFHYALSSLGHRCVFACEIDESLSQIYEKNFGLRPHGNIRTIKISSIPKHDILCAGFPCQPFSKAGDQQGLDCPQSGDLFDYVVRVLRAHKPRYFIIENVPNLVRHRHGGTWRTIKHRLRLAGYSVRDKLLSPHQFGVPQNRERAFIVGRRGGLHGLVWPTPVSCSKLSIASVLDENLAGARLLPKKFVRYLEVWQEFIERFPGNEQLPSFPIWSMEFGATYPYVERSPAGVGFSELDAHRGSFGQSLRGVSGQAVRLALPPYARTWDPEFPNWKIDFIRQNRELYARHRRWMDEWLPSVRDFFPSFQKFEWNCQGEERDIWKNIIQFRASGIRVKRPTTAPSLVAMTTSQIPVIAWERRYMSIRECSRLQGLGDLKYMPRAHAPAVKALGNAVSVDVVRAVARRLLSLEDESLHLTGLSLNGDSRSLSDSVRLATPHYELSAGRG